MTRAYLGIDPGKKGGMALLFWPERKATLVSFSSKTDHDIRDLVASMMPQITMAYLEAIDHAIPRTNKDAATGQLQTRWNAANSHGLLRDQAGFMRGLLAMAQVPYLRVAPGVWQRKMGVLSPKGASGTEKANRLKGKAQQLNPELVITHATAAALLIAWYGALEQEHQGLAV